MDRAKLESEVAGKPTHVLEEMCYRDVDDWTNEARAVILEHLGRRSDRRVGSLVKYCLFCKELNDIKVSQCECGYDFDSGSKRVAVKRFKKAMRLKRLLGLGMILFGSGYLYIRLESILESMAASKAPGGAHLLLGFLLVVIGCGIYNLFTGPGKFAEPFTVIDQVRFGEQHVQDEDR